MEPIRVLLADDHKLVRAGIRSLLEILPGVEVIAEASDGGEALRLIAEHLPALVLMDIAMPGQNGLEATRYLSEEFPDVKVIILSVYSDEEHVYQALRAGAAGYLLKDSPTAELELAIRTVADGQTYLSPPVSRLIIMDYVQRAHARGSSQLERLSPRQTQVLQGIAEGKNIKQLALELDISVKTVETHRAALMARLGVNDIAGLVCYAVKTGLIKLQ